MKKNPYFTISHQNIWFWNGAPLVFVCCIMAVVAAAANVDEKLAEFERLMGLDGQPWKSIRPLFETKPGGSGVIEELYLDRTTGKWKHFKSLWITWYKSKVFNK